MSVIPESELFQLLQACLTLSQNALELTREAGGTDPAPRELHDAFAELVRQVHDLKRHDSVLADESWEWIWQVKPGLNPIQIYGRLAWLNYNLHGLL